MTNPRISNTIQIDVTGLDQERVDHLSRSIHAGLDAAPLKPFDYQTVRLANLVVKAKEDKVQEAIAVTDLLRHIGVTVTTAPKPVQEKSLGDLLKEALDNAAEYVESRTVRPTVPNIERLWQSSEPIVCPITNDETFGDESDDDAWWDELASGTNAVLSSKAIPNDEEAIDAFKARFGAQEANNSPNIFRDKIDTTLTGLIETIRKKPELGESSTTEESFIKIVPVETPGAIPNDEITLTPSQMNIFIKIAEIITEFMDYHEVMYPSDTMDTYDADSLDFVEIIMALEEEFNIEISDEAADRIKNNYDLVLLIEKLLT